MPARTPASKPAATPAADEVDEAQVVPAGSGLRPGWVAAALIAVAVALAAGVFIGIASHGNDDTGTAAASPGAAQEGAVAEDSVDVGFSRDMQDHHAQAVDMSVTVREATDDPQVRTLALDILLTQQQQAGQMFGWLTAWGYPQSSGGELMAWMSDADMGGTDHGTHGEEATDSSGSVSMPGMATSEQLRALERAQGVRAERIYLQLMLPHHRDGVSMAEYAVENATQPQVQRLAQSIVDSQTAELTVLQSMLEARGGPLRDL
jgi:uncharacterized protein (DUF305 family)